MSKEAVLFFYSQVMYIIHNSSKLYFTFLCLLKILQQGFILTMAYEIVFVTDQKKMFDIV